MRKVIFALFSLLFTISIYAQSDNAIGLKILRMTAFAEQVTDCFGICRIERYSFCGDTTINNVNYVKMYLENGISTDTINAITIIYYEMVGAVRETTDSLVYYYDLETNREVLLYDFGWNKDKLIISTSEVGEEYTYALINDVDTIEQNGWKTPFITTLSGGKCLQGIGDVDGFLAPMRRGNMPKCEMWRQQLWCAIDGICPLYQAPNCIDCETCEIATSIRMVTANAPTPFLFQNTPNPFSNETEIKYFVPENADNACIYVFSLNGNLMLTKPITQLGNGSIVISNSELSAGMYIYTLAIDGQEIDSKRMILTEK